jgi:hypothetical protein
MIHTFLEHTFSVEAAQLLVSTVGVVFNSVGLRYALDDVRVLRRSGRNGPRSVIVNGRVQQEVLRLLVQVMLVTVGIIGVMYPPPPPDAANYDEMWKGVVLSRVCLVAVSVLLALKSYLDTRESFRLRTWAAQGTERRKNSIGYDGPERRHKGD